MSSLKTAGRKIYHMKIFKKPIVVSICLLLSVVAVFVIAPGKEILSQYSGRLLKGEDTLSVLEEPPGLDVISDETCISTLLGTYTWQYKNNDGTVTGIAADSVHPLECKEFLEFFEITGATATIRFTEEPDAILNVCCWSDEYWSDSSADSENVSVNGNEIELKPGGYIYEVTAEWNAEKRGYGGSAYYSFYVKVLE